ncbi:helix-turn-helix transcriptional regulator [Siccirubricoccus sp. G192]|uniref:helix-turn-helix transcriptional regulator n=1 Tax=Siccirubricoccus sp. G192 TaxID=2849651 RepID=UPI001C2C82D8|nr:helix-turn-helix transcriptional regulator [Siccirubricoccus sp. G192]MBV1800079.1 helix-turn-helix transcriptional regulator [Siccirubricoccus sp. G192]
MLLLQQGLVRERARALRDSAAMPLPAPPSYFDRLTTFNVVRANDASELDSRSRLSSRFSGPASPYRFHLLDHALLRQRFDNPIFSLAVRGAGAIVATYVDSRFATETAIQGESDLFCFTTPLQGKMTLIRQGEMATGTDSQGLVYRFSPDMRMVTSDESVRTNVFVQVAKLEEALEHMLDKRLLKPLCFRSALDWSSGLTASLKYQLDFIRSEFERPGGVADNAVALASTTDLLMALILRGAAHNHSDQLDVGPASAVPVYVRRAEEFMRVHCASPIHLSDIAAAAGCSVRTLGSAFQRFRGRTPLAALHACRLEQVHAELCRNAGATPIGAVARRYGFTNASRFGIAFRRRFGESPLDTVRRALRS